MGGAARRASLGGTRLDKATQYEEQGPKSHYKSQLPPFFSSFHMLPSPLSLIYSIVIKCFGCRLPATFCFLILLMITQLAHVQQHFKFIFMFKEFCLFPTYASYLIKICMFGTLFFSLFTLSCLPDQTLLIYRWNRAYPINTETSWMTLTLCNHMSLTAFMRAVPLTMEHTWRWWTEKLCIGSE